MASKTVFSPSGKIDALQLTTADDYKRAINFFLTIGEPLVTKTNAINGADELSVPREQNRKYGWGQKTLGISHKEEANWLRHCVFHPPRGVKTLSKFLFLKY